MDSHERLSLSKQVLQTSVSFFDLWEIIIGSEQSICNPTQVLVGSTYFPGMADIAGSVYSLLNWSQYPDMHRLHRLMKSGFYYINYTGS
jgi:hypothetical protein